MALSEDAMNQIKPYQLWVGPAAEANDFRRLFDAGIQALVQVAAEEPPPHTPRELICCHFPLIDGTGNRSMMLSLAIETVSQLLKLHVPTLVVCGSGVSRSSAVAAAALAITHNEPLEDWLKRVVHLHPSDVSPGFWSEVTGVATRAP
jgi:protein-tyrosine phosphatase